MENNESTLTPKTYLLQVLVGKKKQSVAALDLAGMELIFCIAVNVALSDL